MAVRPLTPAEEDLWRVLVRLLVVLPRTMDEDLLAGAGISLTRYIVLVALSEATDGHLRMSELADRIALSPSRMTRVVQGLETDGLVQRSASADDGRASDVTLTAAGLQTLRTAWPTHLATARSVAFDHLDSAHLSEIAAAIKRVLAAAEEPIVDRRSPEE